MLCRGHQSMNTIRISVEYNFTILLNSGTGGKKVLIPFLKCTLSYSCLEEKKKHQESHENRETDDFNSQRLKNNANLLEIHSFNQR